jgi:6-phosphogluconolactonase
MILTRSTRRQFLAAGAALPFAVRSLAEPAAEARWVFLGTDRGPGIFRASWDGATGKLGAPEFAVKAVRPDFLALHPRLPRLYSVISEAGAQAGVASFHVNAASGGLEFAEWQSSLGDGPCFVSVDKTGKSAFVADYSGGSFAAYALGADGSLKSATGSFDCHYNGACGTQGPVHDRQEASHLHCATVAPANDFVLACDLGNDSIEIFPIHPGAANQLGTAQRVAARPGSGPRHVAFHPNHRWLYVIHELDCTVELFDWRVRGHAASLKRREGSAVSTLGPGGKLPVDTACEILVTSSGRYVYTCTRGAGSNTIEVFSVDAKSGGLTRQQQLSCGGSVPRHIAFDPTERWLLCANQNGPGVTVFAHDARTGKLTGPVQTVVANTPMFVQFV